MKPFKLFPSSKASQTVNYLTLTPITLIGSETGPDGNIQLLIPRFTSKLFGTYLFRRLNKKFIHLKLDEIGSATWSLIDGNTSVEDICHNLSLKFGDRIHPVEERVTKFLTGLYHNKFLTFKEIPASTKK